MHLKGYGVDENLVLAHMWFQLAEGSKFDIASEAREDLEKQLTSDQIAEAQRMAREWIEKHQSR